MSISGNRISKKHGFDFIRAARLSTEGPGWTGGVSPLYCAYRRLSQNRPSVGVDGPRRHQACQNEVAVDLRQRRPSMEQISRIGMDTSKHIFQLHGVNTTEEPVLRKKLRRKEMFAFLEQLAPTVIAIEACGAGHHCARLLQSFGHSVKLIAPQLVKPYIKRGKNDAADAEALCEAMSRPTMRFVPVKTAEQQAALMLARPWPADPQSHAVDQRDPWLCGRVRPYRCQGEGSPRSSASAHPRR